jgi:hypothetical protein
VGGGNITVKAAELAQYLDFLAGLGACLHNGWWPTEAWANSTLVVRAVGQGGWNTEVGAPFELHPSTLVRGASKYLKPKFGG